MPCRSRRLNIASTTLREPEIVDTVIIDTLPPTEAIPCSTMRFLLFNDACGYGRTAIARAVHGQTLCFFNFRHIEYARASSWIYRVSAYCVLRAEGVVFNSSCGLLVRPCTLQAGTLAQFPVVGTVISVVSRSDPACCSLYRNFLIRVPDLRRTHCVGLMSA